MKNRKKLKDNVYFKKLLKDKNCSLMDIKSEIVVMMMENFISQYLNEEESFKTKSLLNNEDTPNLEDILIYNKLKVIKEGFKNDDVFTIKDLQKQNSKSLYNTLVFSPYTALYDSCMDVIIKKRKELFSKEELCMWLPDVLAVYLLLDAKEKGFSFKKYPYLEDENFEDILEIYINTFKKLKDVNENISLKNGSIINKIEKMSSSIIDTLYNFE